MLIFISRNICLTYKATSVPTCDHLGWAGLRLEEGLFYTRWWNIRNLFKTLRYSHGWMIILQIGNKNAFWIPTICKVPPKAFSVVHVYILWNGKCTKHSWVIHELFFLRLILALYVLMDKIKHLLHTTVKNTFRFKTEKCIFFKVPQNQWASIITRIYCEKKKFTAKIIIALGKQLGIC